MLIVITQPPKVRVFQLTRPGSTLDATQLQVDDEIYVHSKNLIVDDQYAIVGSHSQSRTAWTNDIEVSTGIEDTSSDADGWVARLRRLIWAEHLQLAVDDPVLVDPVRAADEWARQSRVESSRIRPYTPTYVAELSKVRVLAGDHSSHLFILLEGTCVCDCVRARVCMCAYVSCA